MTIRKLLIVTLVAGVATSPSFAREPRERAMFPSSRPRAESQMDRNMREAKVIGERIRAAEVKEAMRDKTHDGRLRVGANTSISADGKGVNVRYGYR